MAWIMRFAPVDACLDLIYAQMDEEVAVATQALERRKLRMKTPPDVTRQGDPFLR